MTGLIKRCKSKYHQDILRDSADSPDKFWSAIKKLFPTKLTSEQGSAFQVNGTKTTDKKSIAESFCDYFTNVAIKLKKKSFLLRDLVWSNLNGMTLPQVMLFGTAKRLSGFDGKELNLSVNGSRIDMTTNYKYLGVYLDPTLNLDMHFYKTYKHTNSFQH